MLAGAVFAGLFYFRNDILKPTKKKDVTGSGASTLKPNGTAGKYQGDPRDFVAKMKDGVSCYPFIFLWGWALRRDESKRFFLMILDIAQL